MNNLERFVTVAKFDKPDYIPVFGFRGAAGMSGGCQRITHEQLVRTGMPEYVGKKIVDNQYQKDLESWYQYWGTTGPLYLDFCVAWDAEGFKTRKRIENGFEIIESENGAVTRQVIDNDAIYSMPEFITYPVRDRESWEFYKKRAIPRQFMSAEEIENNCRRFDRRSQPLAIGGGSTYGTLRSLMGPEAASLVMYDDPELVHDIVDFNFQAVRDRTFPLIERLKPEIIQTGEDLCYKNGMLLSPAQFDEFFGKYYKDVCDCAFSNDATMVALDTDGNAMEFVSLIRKYGVNAIFPFEVKAGNDLFAIREKHPDFVLFGGLEKEVINEGNGADIEPEIMSKVPRLLEKGGYFPNGDHGIQPLVTFPNLCRFMTVLHEVCNNPEGEFPRC